MSASFKHKTIQIASSTGTYDVLVGSGIFSVIAKIIEGNSILADDFFRPQLAASAKNTVFLPATELEKSLDHAPQTIERLRELGANRSTHLYAVGGGVLQDISAFIASIYMRGLHWSYVPTTVLAMVDSCIGGKSSVNVGEFKNLVGTFHPPENIYIDPTLAETLPRDQFASGLIEAAKICFCRGPESFAAHLACEPSTSMTTEALERVIINSLLAKKYFIEIDEFDKKERLLLNFGHTFGHAIEGASHYGIPHGIAVGLGILCSMAFQRSRGIHFSQLATVLELEAHLDDMIRTLPDLCEQLQTISVAGVLERFASDKKHTTRCYTLILISASGEVVLEQIDRSPELEARVRDAFETTIGIYTQ